MQQGQAEARLMEQGWPAFQVSVFDQARITAALGVESLNSGEFASSSAGHAGGPRDLQQTAAEAAFVRFGAGIPRVAAIFFT